MSSPSHNARRNAPASWLRLLLGLAIALVAAGAPVRAQVVQQNRGLDPRVDYPSLVRLGPWDDRNYQLTADDLALLADNEEELGAQIPAFFRVEMRRANPSMRRTGPAQYPRSALQIFFQLYGGYLVDNVLYRRAEHRDGVFRVLIEEGGGEPPVPERFLDGEVRVTSPVGAAESAIKVNPVNSDLVIAGSNGPGSGQKMHYSTNGGESWSQAAALPLGGTCCDPTVDWSSDGTLAYTATLGNCGGSGCQIWFYRSDDGGQTWDDLPTTVRRTLSSGSSNDKEYIHVDKFAGSPYQDNIYATWHQNNVLQFARSNDHGDTWNLISLSSASDQRGIGSDITSDKAGDVYHFWPATDSQRILLRKSTDGGATLGSVVEVDSTNASYEFPLPSMETRRVFVYVSADADLSNGAYGGSVYVAWTDSTAATGSVAANNHGRIQVAFSRDGGATWSTTTPHETADANTVDRWHPWLAVGPDGTVHVVFYDTRRDPARTKVDLFHSFSLDGGHTWSTPSRLTAEQSPNISDSFEFGDYNGLDVVLGNLIAVFTDNRNEGGPLGDSVDVYAAGIQSSSGNAVPTVTITAPASGASFLQGSSITFSGTATDDEDGDLTSSLAWSSSLDGSIGAGGSFSTSTLSPGSHVVTASATDSGSLTGVDTISLEVVPPMCESYQEDFEGDVSDWTTSGLWQQVTSSTCASPGYSSAVSSLYYGQTSSCDYSTGAQTTGDLISPEIPGVMASSVLRFHYFRQVELSVNNPYDLTEVAVEIAGTGSWTTVWSRSSFDASENAWTPSGDLSLAAFAGETIQVRFRFDSVDEQQNQFVGWLVDDVEVTQTGSALELSSQVVTTTETYSSCVSIRAGNGYSIESPGDVTFDAPSVVLESGFSVGPGATFRAGYTLP